MSTPHTDQRNPNRYELLFVGSGSMEDAEQELWSKININYYIKRLTGWTFWLILIWYKTTNWFSWFMVFNAPFNNISVISWQSVLLVEDCYWKQLWSRWAITGSWEPLVLLPFLTVYMNQIPEKIYLGQWLYITKKYTVDAIWRHCGSHLGGRARLPDTILEEDHPMTIPSKFGSNWATGSSQDGFYVNCPLTNMAPTAELSLT
jgi:hypothetical protein